MFLDTCATHVETYAVYDGRKSSPTLFTPEIAPFPRSVIAFARFPKLKDFAITIPDRYFMLYDCSSILPALLETFEQLAQRTHPQSPYALETLKIEFTIRGPFPELVSAPSLARGLHKVSQDSRLWRGLDRLLGSKNGSLSPLEGVTIALDLNRSDPPIEGAVWEQAKGAILDFIPNIGNRINGLFFRFGEFISFAFQRVCSQ